MRKFVQGIWAAAYADKYDQTKDASLAMNHATAAVRALQKEITGKRPTEMSVSVGVIQALTGEND